MPPGTYYIAAGAFSGVGTYEVAVADSTVEDDFAESTENDRHCRSRRHRHGHY